MNDSYTMIPVKSSTRDIIKEAIRKRTVEKGGTKVTYDDLLLEKFSVKK